MTKKGNTKSARQPNEKYAKTTETSQEKDKDGDKDRTKQRQKQRQRQDKSETRRDKTKTKENQRQHEGVKGEGGDATQLTVYRRCQVAMFEQEL